jgi:hypothetical protein
MISKKLNYLNLEWKFHTKMNMHNKYKNWTMYVFYPAEDKEKVDIEHINGEFNKLSKTCHIAIEHVARNPDGTNGFHDLVIAIPNNEDFPNKLPEWESGYQ